MIWKNIRNKRKWEFNLEYQKEGCQRLNNPVRGWYAIYTFHVQNAIDPEELKWSLRDGESLALLRIDISEYSEREFDHIAKENLKSILKFFKDYQRDVILRPVYDLDGNGREKEPQDFQIVLKHLQQIGIILSQEEHSVFIFQGMLVGSWGEMHDSKYLSKKHLLKMWTCFLEYFDENIYLAVRTPVQWRILSQVSDRNLCIFDDAILASQSHLGTFGTMTKEAAGWENPWNSKEEMSFLDKICEEVPCGGEVVFPVDGRVYTEKEICYQMQQMHLVYLNAVYDQKLLDEWKSRKIPNSKWNNYFHYVGEHLGYRFVVENIAIAKTKRKELQICGNIRNTGFGSLVQKAELIMYVEHEQGIEEKQVNIDLFEIKAGECQQFIIKILPQEAKIFLKMQRKKDGRTIFFANKNATDKLYIGCLWQG